MKGDNMAVYSLSGSNSYMFMKIILKFGEKGFWHA